MGGSRGTKETSVLLLNDLNVRWRYCWCVISTLTISHGFVFSIYSLAPSYTLLTYTFSRIQVFFWDVCDISQSPQIPELTLILCRFYY